MLFSCICWCFCFLFSVAFIVVVGDVPLGMSGCCHTDFWNSFPAQRISPWTSEWVLPLTAGQFSVKLLFKNFPVVILCIGIILVFQNIIHGGWWWYCRRGGGTDGIWCKRISVPNFPVVILCIGIILVFQNIIHGGWWWCCRRGGDTDGIWYKRIYVPNFIT